MNYAGEDKELMFDSLKLKGICNYRLNNPLESIKNFGLANRYRTKEQKVTKNRDEKKKELEYTFINLFIEETKLIFNDKRF